MKAIKATVVEVNEKGRHSILKTGLVARQNTRGAWVWNPGKEGETVDTAEWFPFQSKRLYLRMEGVKV